MVVDERHILSCEGELYRQTVSHRPSTDYGDVGCVAHSYPSRYIVMCLGLTCSGSCLGLKSESCERPSVYLSLDSYQVEGVSGQTVVAREDVSVSTENETTERVVGTRHNANVSADSTGATIPPIDVSYGSITSLPRKLSSTTARWASFAIFRS